MHILEILFGFHGKLTQKEWWFSNFIMWGLTLLIVLIEWKLDFHPVALGSILTVVWLWMRLAVNFKRLRDGGLSPYWMLLEIFFGVGAVILFIVCMIKGSHADP